MALGWWTLLKHVPWAGVIASAPLVADGAKQLWNAVARKPAVPEPPVPFVDDAADGDDAAALAALTARVTALEAGMEDQHAQMLKSSELIKALADQNARLVERVEASRVRAQWLTGLAVLALILSGIAFATVMFR